MAELPAEKCLQIVTHHFKTSHIKHTFNCV